MMNLFRRASWAVLLSVLMALNPLLAQTTVNSTTLAAALNATDRTVSVASNATIAKGDWLMVDGEAMLIQDFTGTLLTVVRGQQGSRTTAHANSTTVWTGVPARFYQNEPSGTCTAANELFLPHLVPRSGSIYQCQSGEWVLWQRNGIRQYSDGRSDGGTTYTTAGAIAVQPGISFIGSAGALAMTLVDPTVQQNGMIMTILASTAQAHTVTNTTGFGGGTTARDVCTFGGAINDGLTIIAFNAVWWVINTRNCTLA